MTCRTAEAQMNGQLALLGCCSSGSAIAANIAAEVVTNTVVSSLSLPLFTTAFQLAWRAAANRTIAKTVTDMGIAGQWRSRLAALGSIQ